ncbi:GTPase IMAP family member 8-like [Cyprinus carpio]|uniref:GTPase IMAP family member 8-like n=1 Tax=Cyprinus carpio TaxID=7962 RepID=A0A9R0AP02_CYPCA|nr:GTPase IMAP family member 8-like [Cyprinus carpio]
MSDLRIVLIGKNGSENSRVANTLLGTEAFHSEASSYSQQHSVRISGEMEERHITVINPPHLLQQNLSQHQITQTVRECVSLSAPGPHVFILIMQYNDFRENDRHRVKYLLNLFSEQAMKHTIVLTTDEDTRGLIYLTCLITNNAIHDLIKECGGGHLQFDTVNTRRRSELFRRTEEILKKEHEEFLLCNMYEDGGDATPVDGDLSRSGASDREDDKEKKDSDLKESTKIASDGGGLDESRITLMFFRRSGVCDVTETSSVALLMSELMKGGLTERPDVTDASVVFLDLPEIFKEDLWIHQRMDGLDRFLLFPAGHLTGSPIKRLFRIY